MILRCTGWARSPRIPRSIDASTHVVCVPNGNSPRGRTFDLALEAATHGILAGINHTVPDTKNILQRPVVEWRCMVIARSCHGWEYNSNPATPTGLVFLKAYMLDGLFHAP